LIILCGLGKICGGRLIAHKITGFSIYIKSKKTRDVFSSTSIAYKCYYCMLLHAR
jgi:hypothetical protein